MSQYDSPPTSGNGYDPLPVTDPPTASYSGASISHDSGPSSTPEVAADQAKQVGHEALDSGRQVAEVAADEASSVVGEAGTQAKNLLGEARTQLTDQAATQQNNLATWISSIVDELDRMVDRSEGGDTQSGAATSLVRQVSSRARSAAGWLAGPRAGRPAHGDVAVRPAAPGDVPRAGRRRRTVAGRLTRGLTADASPSTGPRRHRRHIDAGATPTSAVRVVTAPPTSRPAAVQPFYVDENSTGHGGTHESGPRWHVR